MRTSEKLDQLLLALAKARPNFGEIKKSAFNPHFGRHYADMADIMGAVELPLAAEGLNFIGTLEYLEIDRVEVTQRLMHVSEQYLESVGQITYPPGQLQKLGTDVSYFRRYSVNTMLALSSEVDTDGEPSQPPAADRRASRKPQPPVDPPGPPPHGAPAATAPTGKPTPEEIEILRQVMRHAYLEEEAVAQALREALQIPDGIPLTRASVRGAMTRERYHFLYDAARRLTDAQTREDMRAPGEPQDDTPPLGGAIESGETPTVILEATRESGADAKAGDAPPDETFGVMVIDAEEPPVVAVGPDKMVLAPGMDLLRARATKYGKAHLIAKIQGSAPGMPLGPFTYAWDQVGPKGAKVGV